MIRSLKLIWMFARVSVQNDAAYRFDFLLRIVVAILHLGAELMGVWVIYSNTKSLNGWGVWESLTLLGVYRAIVGSIRIFIAPNMRSTMEDIRTGTLDYVLMRPVGSQFLASVRRVVLYELFDVMLGVGLATFSTVKLLGRMPAVQVLGFLFYLALGVTIVYSIWLTLATTSFWFTRVANIEMVFWNVFEVARYPVAIYPPAFRWFFTFVIPVMFITNVPAQAFFGKLPSMWVLVSGCITAPVMFLLASAFWRFGVRRYSGASA